MSDRYSRRGFLALLPASAAGFLAPWRSARPAPSVRPEPRACVRLAAVSTRGPHPTPRPGIDASRVLEEAEIEGGEEVVAAFNEVRQIPQVVDGIRCHCGCADLEGYYSLLTCFERPDAMARYCDLCQGHGRYAFRLHRAGRSLDDIRAAIDARYGD